MSPLRFLLPIAFLVIFIAYIIYLIITKKDMKIIKQTALPGVFFIGIWALILLIYFV